MGGKKTLRMKMSTTQISQTFHIITLLKTKSLTDPNFKRIVFQTLDFGI